MSGIYNFVYCNMKLIYNGYKMPFILFGNNQMAILSCSGVTCVGSNASGKVFVALFCKEHWHFYMCMKELTVTIPITALLWSQRVSDMCKLSRKFRSFLAVLKSLLFRHVQVAFAIPVFSSIWGYTLNSFLNDFEWV